MLVLARKVHQSVQIGEVTVIIAKLSKNVVKLGITAPKEMRIVRTEIDDKVDSISNTGVECGSGNSIE
jgi:carbon storage regulator